MLGLSEMLSEYIRLVKLYPVPVLVISFHDTFSCKRVFYVSRGNSTIEGPYGVVIAETSVAVMLGRITRGIISQILIVYINSSRTMSTFSPSGGSCSVTYSSDGSISEMLPFTRRFLKYSEAGRTEGMSASLSLTIQS